MKFKFLFFVILLSVLSIARNKNDYGIHSKFNDILKAYVKNGLVDYENLRNDKGFDEYIQVLVNTNPDTITDKNERLAFWINAYNAYTLKIVCDNYPVESITDLSSGGKVISYVLKTTVWDKDFVKINNKTMSLNDIEHKIIRKKFKEPRIHFALVCAAISCPPLRNEAYTGQKLDDQLSDQAKIFFSDKSKNHFDLNNQTAYISSLLSWYDEDFGKNNEQMLISLSPYFPVNISENIKNDPGKWELEFNDYNWLLNKQ